MDKEDLRKECSFGKDFLTYICYISDKNAGVIRLPGNDEQFTLWAEGVFDLDGISKVMASILTSEGTEVEKNTFAWNHETERYEYEHNGLPKGTYFAVVTAEDRKGNISNPHIVTIYSGVDINGEDDTLDTANVIILNQTPQQHYFHDAGDVDWVKFYGIADKRYEIGTSALGYKCDTIVELYDSKSNSLLHRNNGGVGENEFLSWQCSEDGVYYVRISHVNGKDCGQGTNYKLWIYYPFAGVPGTLEGRIMDEAGNGIGGAVLKSDICNIAGISESNGYYTINPISGIHTIIVTAAGFKSQSQEGVAVTSESNVSHDFILKPLPDLVSIKIEILSGGLVSNALPEVGQTAQFKATGIYYDASTEVMTGSVTWNSSDTSKGDIRNTGLFEALSEGSTYVTASLGGVTSNRVIMNVQVSKNVNIDPAQLPEIMDAGETVNFGPAVSGGTGAGFAYAIDFEPAYGAGLLVDDKFSVDETMAFAGNYVIRVTDKKNDDVWSTYTIKVPMKLEPNSFVMREDIVSQTFTLKGAAAGTTFTVTQYDPDGNDVSNNEGYGNFDNGDGGSPAEVFTYTMDDIDEIKSFKIRFVAFTPDESLENAGLHELTSGIYRVIPMDRFFITVSDTNGIAIADANVSIDYPDVTAKTTDVNGRAEFILPDADNTFSYAVTSTGYVNKKFSSGEKAVSVTLETASDAITGIVKDMSGNSLANVSLLAYQFSNFQTKYDTKTVTNGSYTINLPAGSLQGGWVVVASHEDYVPVRQTDQPVGIVDFTDANSLQKKTVISSVTATMAGDTVLLGITANPSLTSVGQIDMTVVTGSGSLSNPFFFDDTISVTYNAAENFTLIIKADTSEDNDPNNGYRAMLCFTYVANETSTGSIHSGIDLGSNRLYLNTNTQTAYVNVPVAGVTNDATIVIKQVPKTMDSTATKASPIYIYEVTALDSSTGKVLSQDDINCIEITLPIDLNTVNPGDIEAGNYVIYYAQSLAALEKDNGKVVPAANIINTDYIGNGITGSVTFRVNHLSVFGIGVAGGDRRDIDDYPQKTGDNNNNSCFIATAAYGSPLDGHVKILREFRDVYLMPNSLGHAFVDAYYKYSPNLAKLIDNHGSLKAIVQVALLPVVGMSYAALYLGHFWSMIVFTGLVVFFTVSFRYLWHRKLGI